MVAITVILAAVIAAFVLGLGDTNESAPSVTWEYEYDSSSNLVDVTMTGGESFEAQRVSFSGDPGTDPGSGSENLTDDDTLESYGSISAGDTVSAGDSVTVDVFDGDFELDIIFTSEDGGTSSTIGGTTGPDA